MKQSSSKIGFINVKGVSISIFLVMLLLSLFSCSSQQKIAYLQDVYGDTKQSPEELYDARIKPKDLLTITVNTFDKEASLPFNLVYPTGSANVVNGTSSETAIQKYLVDNEGYIDFPVLGKIKVADLTKNEVESSIKEKLKPYLKETPVVIVRMVNYKISVIGEVNKPNTYTITNEKVNVLEALALAGDLTIYGKRDNVKLMRESSDGKRVVITLDLTDKNLINSPYFYLQQNDVLYVEPNKTKMRNSRYSALTGQVLSGVSVLVSVVSLVVTLSK